MSKRIFDAHCDTVQRIVDKGTDIRQRSCEGHIDLPRLRDAGVGCQVFACYVSPAEARKGAKARARSLIDAARALGRAPDVVMPASAAELDTLAGADETRLGVLLSIENGAALGRDPGMVAEARALGVRAITLVWGDNELGGGAFGDGRGLSALGREVVREMERHGVLIDLSHASDATLDDVLAVTDGPVIASHSNARALCSTPRNLTDVQARAIAARGGVIGVTFVSGFLDERAWQHEAPLLLRCHELARGEQPGYEQALAHIDEELAAGPRASITAIIDHVSRLVDVAGIDAVGFGTDFDGFSRGPLEVHDCRDLARVTDLLRARGLSAAELDKLSWDNWARVFGSTFA